MAASPYSTVQELDDWCSKLLSLKGCQEDRVSGEEEVNKSSGVMPTVKHPLVLLWQLGEEQKQHLIKVDQI